VALPLLQASAAAGCACFSACNLGQIVLPRSMICTRCFAASGRGLTLWQLKRARLAAEARKKKEQERVQNQVR